MRRKKEAVLCFESNDDGLPKVVRDYRERYRVISQVLDDNPEILSAIHRDLLKLSEGDAQGREGDYTSENIFRALIVQHLEGLPFRDTVIRIGSDPFLQDFAADAKETGDGLLVPRQVLPGHRAENLETSQRTAWPVRSCGGDGPHERHPHRHDRRGIQHPLSHRFVAPVGHLASGVAAAETGHGDRPGLLPASVPRPQDQAAVSVHHPLHAEQVGLSSAESESVVSHADRANGLDRGGGRGILRKSRLDRGAIRRWRPWRWNSRRICRR